MAGFIGRWLGDSIRLGLALSLALLAMQLPGLANAYHAGLLQAAEATARDIAAREQVARDYYRLPESTTGPALVEALRQPEPANAEGLRNSAEREGLLRETHARIAAMPELLRPVTTIWDALVGERGEKAAILRTAWNSYVPQLLISGAAAVYGLAGLMLGLLLAQIVLAPFGRRQRQHAAAAWR